MTANKRTWRKSFRKFKLIIIMGFFSSLFSSCSKSTQTSSASEEYKHDFSTPQGAILLLEDAFRKRDIEAAVHCKHFPSEARLMRQKMGNGLESDEEIVAKTAQALELTFRKFTQDQWPDFTRISSYFIDQKTYADGIEIVTEGFRYPDGGTATQQHYVARTPDGWRVLNPVE